MRPFFGVCVFWLVGCVAWPVSALTLQEAVEAGLKNSHGLKEASHGTEIERYRRDSAESAFLPKVTTRYGYSRTNRMTAGLGRESSSAGVEVGWNVFNGMTDLNTFRSAEAGFQARQYQEQGLVEDHQLAVIHAYIDALGELKKRAVALQSVTLLESQLKTTRLSYRVGLFPKNEVLKVESKAVTAQREYLEAQRRARVSIFKLGKVTGLHLAGEEPLEDFPEVPPEAPDLEQLKTLMDANRSELKYLSALLTSKCYDVDAAQGRRWPSLGLSAQWTHYGDSGVPDGRSSDFNDDAVVRADLSWTLFDGTARKSQIRSARSEVSRVQENTLEMRETFETALKSVVEDYRYAAESFNVAHTEVASAQENRRVTEAMVKANAATPTDLLDANLMLTQAEYSRAEARYAMYRAMAEMERAVEAPLFFMNGKRFFQHD